MLTQRHSYVANNFLPSQAACYILTKSDKKHYDPKENTRCR